MYLYWGAIILVLFVIFYIMRKEHMSEFRTVLENRQYIPGPTENMDFGPTLVDRAYIERFRNEHAGNRCPANVDPLEAQFMSSSSMKTNHNPCTL